MLDIKFIRDNPEKVAEAARLKGVEFDVEATVRVGDAVRQLQTSVDEGQRVRREIADRFKSATPDQREELRGEAKANDDELKANRARLEELRSELREYLLRAPNIPWEGSPVGDGEADNVVIRQWGTPREFDFEALDHVDLFTKRNWAEFDRARKTAGDRAYALKNDAVLLERAIHSYAIDVLLGKQFELVSTPVLAQRESLVGTGFLPGHAEEIYYLERDELFLAGTSEVALVGLNSNEVIDARELPRRYAGLSTCFRREVGSAGRDVRGLLRVHQFEKVEQFIICAADQAESDHWHEQLLGTSEQILQAFELPHQVVECCTGDMGLGKYRMNDINTWFPSLQTYRETHSCSSLGSWQARRAGIRYKDADGVIHFAYTLNNTAVATPRLLGALVENNQQADGSVTVPAVLQPYLGGRAVL